jgi:hypothetical protein
MFENKLIIKENCNLKIGGAKNYVSFGKHSISPRRA